MLAGDADSQVNALMGLQRRELDESDQIVLVRVFAMDRRWYTGRTSRPAKHCR